MVRILVSACLMIALQFSTLNAIAAGKTATSGDHAIPYKRTGEVETGTSVVRVVSGLILVIAVGFGVILAIRRYIPASYGASAASASRHIDLLETRRLTPRLTLYLLDVDGQKLLLAHSSEALTLQHLQPGEKDDRSVV